MLIIRKQIHHILRQSPTPQTWSDGSYLGSITSSKFGRILPPCVSENQDPSRSKHNIPPLCITNSDNPTSPTSVEVMDPKVGSVTFFLASQTLMKWRILPRIHHFVKVWTCPPTVCIAKSETQLCQHQSEWWILGRIRHFLSWIPTPWKVTDPT